MVSLARLATDDNKLRGELELSCRCDETLQARDECKPRELKLIPRPLQMQLLFRPPSDTADAALL